MKQKNNYFFLTSTILKLDFFNASNPPLTWATFVKPISFTIKAIKSGTLASVALPLTASLGTIISESTVMVASGYKSSDRSDRLMTRIKA